MFEVLLDFFSILCYTIEEIKRHCVLVSVQFCKISHLYLEMNIEPIGCKRNNYEICLWCHKEDVWKIILK